MPVALDLAAILVAFCVFLIAWLLLQGYRNTFGLLLGKIAEETADLSIAGVHPFGWLSSGLKRIDHFILYSLGLVVQSSAWAWHKLIGQLASFIHETMSLLADLASATEAELSRLRRHVIPAAISLALGPLASLAYSLRKQLGSLAVRVERATTHALSVASAEAIKQVRRIEKTIEARAHAALVATSAAVAGVLPRLGRVERELHGIDERLRDALRRVSPAVIAGAVAVAVARLGLSAARCSRTQRWNRSVCGMDDNLLESLVSDTLLILGTVSLVEFAQGMQDVTAELAPAVRFFWRA